MIKQIAFELATQVAETKAMAHVGLLVQLEILANLSGQSMDHLHEQWSTDLERWRERYLAEMTASIVDMIQKTPDPEAPQ